MNYTCTYVSKTQIVSYILLDSEQLLTYSYPPPKKIKKNIWNMNLHRVSLLVEMQETKAVGPFCRLPPPPKKVSLEI